jgi:hypothetical protein
MMGSCMMFTSYFGFRTASEQNCSLRCASPLWFDVEHSRVYSVRECTDDRRSPILSVGLGIAVLNVGAAREVWQAAREEHRSAVASLVR